MQYGDPKTKKKPNKTKNNFKIRPNIMLPKAEYVKQIIDENN